jgi:hypothetical protein
VAGVALNNDPDRPTLHHGKPEGSMDASDLPSLNGIPGDMRQMVAVSDAANRPTHIFTRAWTDAAERAQVLAKMQAFARAQLATYKTPPGGSTVVTSVASTKSSDNSGAVTAPVAPTRSSAQVAATAEQDPGAPTLKRGIPTAVKPQTQDASTASSTTAGSSTSPSTSASTAASAPPKTTASTRTTTSAAARARAKKAQAPTDAALVDEDLRGYTLSYGGAPTFVYMAHTDGVGVAERFVTVVAQDNGVGTDGPGGLGELKLALGSVTDAAHLDRTPQMRLVDAVDAEASNRASLLFELRGQSSRQFALYRVIAAKPEQLFVTGTTE